MTTARDPCFARLLLESAKMQASVGSGKRPLANEHGRFSIHPYLSVARNRGGPHGSAHGPVRELTWRVCCAESETWLEDGERRSLVRLSAARAHQPPTCKSLLASLEGYKETESFRIIPLERPTGRFTDAITTEGIVLDTLTTKSQNGHAGNSDDGDDSATVGLFVSNVAREIQPLRPGFTILGDEILGYRVIRRRSKVMAGELLILGFKTFIKTDSAGGFRVAGGSEIGDAAALAYHQLPEDQKNDIGRSPQKSHLHGRLPTPTQRMILNTSHLRIPPRGNRHVTTCGLGYRALATGHWLPGTGFQEQLYFASDAQMIAGPAQMIAGPAQSTDLAQNTQVTDFSNFLLDGQDEAGEDRKLQQSLIKNLLPAS
ncbi:hypothetical protein NUW58_g2177 [Xylaria curta]|uniref:Uncharacterized protein n=1 Tax=Xylaria curta TaxID=42375 RepID=A0ACC1PGT5_9PEZI|nr:hypothetical protein NUW58_g2177 [Xylaria curta]